MRNIIIEDFLNLYMFFWTIGKKQRCDRSMARRGQIGLFVIVAIVILAIVIAFLLFRDVGFRGTEDTLTPQQYLASCIEPAITPIVSEIGAQGGYEEPEGFIVYNDTKLPYLCYTSEYFKPCVIQQPDPLGTFERSLNSVLSSEAVRCAEQFEEEFERRGYRISRSTTNVNVSFAPGRLSVQVIAPMTVSRDVSRTYQSFDLSFESELYEIVSIAGSILDFESTYGDAEITSYLHYYPNIKIQKTKLSDGSKVYSISNVGTQEQFTFATRSLAWAAGYPPQ